MTDAPEDLTRIAENLSLAVQTATLRLLEAEMQALAHVIPGMALPAKPMPTQDEVEQGFENMPI